MADSKVSTDEVVLGIDLGTTFSCVGAWVNGEVRILNTLPSYVSFGDDQVFYGWEAKNRAPENPTTTVFDAKRLIGLKFDNEAVQRDIKTLGFDVRRLPENNIGIVINTNGEETTYSPCEISSMVLENIKNQAEAQVGPVSKAVITVPAYFNDAQRSATKAAGKLAGLDVMRIINEPTAAAMAYGMNKKQEENILIFDLGGGTFDVSLLTIDDGIFEVKATSGDTHLGGEDFDTRLVERCLKEFKRQTDLDASNDPTALRTLRTECEKYKIQLSDVESVNISIDNLYNGHGLKMNLTRQEFDAMNSDYYNNCKAPIEEVLYAESMNKENIHEVVLVGGSTRIPGIQKLLVDYFNGKELCNSIDPDEAVATGATLQAAIMIGADEKFKDVLLVDVLPLSLGIAVGGKKMDILMRRNSPIPRSVKEIYTTYNDNQESVLVQVYEGERERVEDNYLLGAFELEVEPAPAGVPQVEVTFVINSDGILQVTGQNVNTGTKRAITVRNQNKTDEELYDILEETEHFKEEDEEAKLTFEAKEGLREYTIHVKNSGNVDTGVKLRAQDMLNWLEQNENCPRLQYEQKQRELEEVAGEC